MLNTTFKGTGTMKKFVAESTAAFSAINQARVDMPPGYDGQTPLFRLEGSGENTTLVLDLKDASVFNVEKVGWNTLQYNAGSSDYEYIAPEDLFDEFSVTVSNGNLYINIKIT